MIAVPEPSSLAVFVAAALVMLLTPGPAVLYIVTRSIDQGRRAGLVSMLGVHAGTLVHVVAAAAGVSAVLAASATAFSVVKYLGAAYLIYLGVRKLANRTPALAAPDSPPRQLRRAFLDGVVVNVLNPKTALFFLAFLPQFADATRGPLAPQILLLGCLFVFNGFFVCAGYALVASRLGDWLKSRWDIGAWLNRSTGVLYIALGLRLALEQRK